MGAFEASRGTAFERFAVEDLIIVPTASVINTLTPKDRVRVDRRTLVSAGSNLTITRGCEGVEVFALLVAAILAYPATLRQRVVGVVVGGALTYVLSLGRLAALHYTLRYYPAAWEASHGIIAPLVPVIAVGLYFSRWLPASSAPTLHAGRSSAP
jgi:exosortase family protein XrtM